MERKWIQRAVSDGETEIVGGVYGQGPPLVLVHGAVADGESEWGEMLPLLTGRFTCYVPSTRGRGLSGGHFDPSREARVRDIAAFVDGIGDPVRLAGVSGGGMVALGVAARTSAVSAVAVHEPVVLEAAGEELLARLQSVLDRMIEAAGKGETVAAIEPFLELIANDEETAAMSETPGASEELARYLPIDIEEFREAFAFQGPSPTDPATLERITAPVLVSHGSRTAMSTWFTAGVRHVTRHAPEATAREIAGVGHFGALFAPERMAGEFVPFLETARQAA